MTEIRIGGDWVVEALRAEGVRHVFGIPGVHNLAVYDALLRQSTIRHVLARHEQGAAFMADGYARASGRPGVVLVTTGPGATNALTPLVESFASSVPVVLIMSDIAAPLVGRDLGALHEVPNQIDCFRPVCRLVEPVGEARDIPTSIAGGFDLLRSGRPGPVAISIPNDLLGARVDAAVRPASGARPPCHVNDIAEAATRLRAATRPLIIAGGGVVTADAAAELEALARRLGAPVITTVMGRGAISERDPLWHGVLPNGRAVEPVIKAADVVFAIGCRFAHRSTQGLLLNLSFSPDQTLIHLDIDPTVIGKLFKPQVAVVGDARDGLLRLLGALGPGRAAPAWDRAWLAGLRTASSPLYTPVLAEFMEALRRALPDDGIVACDQTGVNYWMEWRFPVLAPRTFLYPIGSAALGYGLPAAIGAKLAQPTKPVIVVVGDGGLLFSLGELATAVKYRLPLVILLMNDDRYGAIKWLQEKMFQGRWGEADLANPDFVALAHAFGARAERLPGVEALPRAVATALTADGPTLLELSLDVEPPWDV
jgi:thiamine pyrophosphate-dependent acetolactate synthase large subunit-like protein